jgi:hypothetical protein
VIYESAGGHQIGTFSDLRLAVDRTCRAMRPKLGRFDALVVRGVSGVAVGAPVSIRLGVPLLVVRKPGETKHCGLDVIGLHVMDPRFRWIHLDDFSDTGATERECQWSVRQTHPSAQQVGSFFYHSLLFHSKTNPWFAPLRTESTGRDTESPYWRLLCPGADRPELAELAGDIEEVPSVTF